MGMEEDWLHYGLLSDENTSLFLLCDNMHSLAYVLKLILFVALWS